MHKEREVVALSQGADGVEEGHISRIVIVNQKVSSSAISDTSQHNMQGTFLRPFLLRLLLSPGHHIFYARVVNNVVFVWAILSPRGVSRRVRIKRNQELFTKRGVGAHITSGASRTLVMGPKG